MAGIFGRIRAIRETEIYYRCVVVDPARSLTSDHRQRELVVDACIADIENSTKVRPHLTLVDKEIFVQGWRQGHEWSVRNRDKLALSSEQSASENLTASGVPEVIRHDL
jgi:hypothetical protein